MDTRSIEYRYDLLNRLVLRRLDSNGAATAGGVSDTWLAGYDGISPTLPLSSLSSFAVTNRYLWGPGVDFLLADEQLTAPTAPGQPLAACNTLWPLGDRLGTLRDLADFSGATFTITNHRVFDTFGRLLSETNSAVVSHFAFTGKFFDDLGDTDPTTSLSHHWNRWCDPQAGKWISEDPIAFAAGDANLGRYVGNHVLRYRDSNGLDLLDTIANLSAGLGDGMSFGIGWVIRDKLVGIETVDYDSGGYYWGGWTGVVADFLTGGGTAVLKSLGKGVAKSTGKKIVKEAVEEGAEFIGREVLEQTARGADDLVRAADDLIKGTDEVIQTLKGATKAADEAIRQADELLKVVDSGGDSTKLLDDLLAPNSVQSNPNLVAGPNPNGLRQRAVTSPTAGEGGVYLKPHGGRTKVGSTGDFDGRYGPNAKPGIEVEIPQTRSGPPAGVDDSAYPWSARAQRRFDEEYIDRITPPDVRFRAPNARSPVDPDKWDRFRHFFGCGDLPSDFGF